MKNQYVKKAYPIDKIIINPDNARFYDNTTDSIDDIQGINGIISLNSEHVINLAKDIAESGLIPNQEPIVMPLKNRPGYVLAYDGNRRLSSLKLITTYKDKLDKFPLSIKEKSILLGLTSDIEAVECVTSDDVEYVKNLLLKLHTETVPGIRQVGWVPQAQSKHLKQTKGIISKELSFVSLLENLFPDSTDLSAEIKNGKWASKLKRFLNKKNFMLLIGVEILTDSKIVFYFSKTDLKDILLEFFSKINKSPAREIAQSVALQTTFMLNFIKTLKIENRILNNMSYVYDPYTDTLSYTKKQLNKAKFKNNLNLFITKNTVPVSTTDASTQNPVSPQETDTGSTQNPVAPPTKSAASDVSGTHGSPNSTNACSKKPKKFFASLQYTKINPLITKELPLYKICDEIKKFSKGTSADPQLAYEKYPIAATILFRSLVEQCLKHLLRKAMPLSLNTLKNKLNGGDPLLGDLIKLVSNNKKILFQDTTLRRHYSALFDGSGFKDGLDLGVHHSRTDVDFLEEKSKNFLFITEHILNSDLKIEET